MGNRALVCFKNSDTITPAVYIHWCNDRVPQYIGALKRRMIGREGDAQYACARFCGMMHDRIKGNLSLGIIDHPITLFDANNDHKPEVLKRLRDASHGDAGFVIVDTKDFTWKAYGGYLEGYVPQDRKNRKTSGKAVSGIA